MKEGFNKETFKNIVKILIKDVNYGGINLRKDKDFQNSVRTSYKNYTDIKKWFDNSTDEFENLGLFFNKITSNETIEQLKEILR